MQHHRGGDAQHDRHDPDHVLHRRHLRAAGDRVDDAVALVQQRGDGLQQDEQRHRGGGRVHEEHERGMAPPPGRDEARVADADDVPRAAVRAPRLVLGLAAERQLAHGRHRHVERGAVPDVAVPHGDRRRGQVAEHLVLLQVLTQPEPPLRGFEAGVGVAVRSQRSGYGHERRPHAEPEAEEAEVRCVARPCGLGQREDGGHGQERWHEGQHPEDEEVAGPPPPARQAQAAGVAAHGLLELLPPLARRRLRSGRQRLARHDALRRQRADVAVHLLLVAREVAGRVVLDPHDRAAGLDLLDVDDAAAGQVEQRRRDRLVAEAPPARDEVDDGRRLRSEVHRRRPGVRLPRPRGDRQQREQRGPDPEGHRGRDGEPDSRVEVPHGRDVLARQSPPSASSRICSCSWPWMA